MICGGGPTQWCCWMKLTRPAPEVFDIFLQIFDEGRLSDAHGRPVDARHSVFIMTSNIGTRESSKVMGFGGHDDDAEPDFFALFEAVFSAWSS
ncbi:AAA domain-containing protein [bacterium]|nr:AAA domain-containing protein [bacterium]